MTTHWVFGYGSLMWNPGFAHLRHEPAELQGYHRELCVYSFHYRGTPENQGLVFGLAAGGSCQGVAFEVDAGDWSGTQEYLREREQITMVYQEIIVPITLKSSGESVLAMTYAADSEHAQCALGLDDAAIVTLVQSASGIAGSCADYVRNTHDRMVNLGISDPALARLVVKLV